MDEDPPFVKLAHLEIKLMRDAITPTEYRRIKWEILCEVLQSRATVKPVFKSKRKKYLKNQLDATFSLILPGPFIYGLTYEYCEITSPFYIAQFPVTVGEFEKFLAETSWDYPASDLHGLRTVSPFPLCPASHIGLADAEAYCAWISKETGETYRLPSEAEWEIASRGLDGRPYPWGYTPINAGLACYHGRRRSYSSTMPADHFDKNRSVYNCWDTVGNVWEWCTSVDDHEPESHVLRGGGWNNDRDSVTCTASATCEMPNERLNNVGFRLIYIPSDLNIKSPRRYGRKAPQTCLLRRQKSAILPAKKLVLRKIADAPPLK